MWELAVKEPAKDIDPALAPKTRVSGRLMVAVPLVLPTVTSLVVPLILRTAPVVASLRTTLPDVTSKPPESNLATPLFEAEASSPATVTLPAACVTSIPSPPSIVSVWVLGVYEPLSVVTMRSTESSSSTSPEVTLKSALAKEATPLLEVLAS